MSAVAVELAEEVLDDLPGRQVLVIGAGRMAEATALALVRHGVREVVVANRTVGHGRASWPTASAAAASASTGSPRSCAAPTS